MGSASLPSSSSSRTAALNISKASSPTYYNTPSVQEESLLYSLCAPEEEQSIHCAYYLPQHQKQSQCVPKLGSRVLCTYYVPQQRQEQIPYPSIRCRVCFTYCVLRNQKQIAFYSNCILLSTASIRSRMQTFAECTPALEAECIVWVFSFESRVHPVLKRVRVLIVQARSWIINWSCLPNSVGIVPRRPSIASTEMGRGGGFWGLGFSIIPSQLRLILGQLFLFQRRLLEFEIYKNPYTPVPPRVEFMGGGINPSKMFL